MRVGLVQLTVGDDPEENLPETLALVRAAAEGGAKLVLTPECTNMLSSSRDRQRALLCHEEEDPTLAALRHLRPVDAQADLTGARDARLHVGDALGG